MSPTRRNLALVAVTAAASLFALAPTAGAALPTKGRFYNGSGQNGGLFYTTKHTITGLQLFCGQERYDVLDAVHIRRNGTFSYRGRGDKYETAGALRGTHWKIRLSGRFTSSSRVKIKRTLEGCGTATVTLRRENS